MLSTLWNWRQVFAFDREAGGTEGDPDLALTIWQGSYFTNFRWYLDKRYERVKEHIFSWKLNLQLATDVDLNNA